jgi:hypothetical protein
MSYTPSSGLEKELSMIIGRPILIQTECGLCVRDMSNFDVLLSVSKPPKSYDAAWILNKIEKKNKQAEDMRARREKIITEMRKSLIEKGIKDFSTYETTFGFSVCNLFQDGLKYAREVIEKCGIQYKKIEYSPEHWVVRVFV